MLKKVIGGTLLLAGASFVALPVAHANNPTEEHKVFVCHATDSDTHPYNIINVDTNSTSYQGHLTHRDDPNKEWKSAGTFAGINHTEGQPKPDVIGTADPTSIAKCFDVPPVTVTTTIPVITATEPTTTTTIPVTTTTTPSATTTTATVPTVTKTKANVVKPPVTKATTPVPLVTTQAVVPPKAKDNIPPSALARTGFDPAGLFSGLAMLLAGTVLLVGKRLTVLRK